MYFSAEMVAGLTVCSASGPYIAGGGNSITSDGSTNSGGVVLSAECSVGVDIAAEISDD